MATDIVARGIDIDDITMVINYDAPHDAEDYVHRIGRTARAGREGAAITLIGEKDMVALASIERILKIKIPREKLPEGLKKPESDARRGRDGRGGHERSRGSRNGKERHDHQRTVAKGQGQRVATKQKPTSERVHGDRPRSEKPTNGKARQHRGRGGKKGGGKATAKTE